ncbi:MAG: UvrB/UvrC motif-containing protein, partial [Gemmataceae bacterium]
MQFYHRRVCWMALGRYTAAVQDADHTLAFMDFVKKHSPSEEFTQAHEQYRGFVVFHRTQAAVAAKAEAGDADGAIDAVRAGILAIQKHLDVFDPDSEYETDPLYSQLLKLEANIRSAHDVGLTLQEQLEQAIAEEDYEAAARLRDAIRQQQPGRTDNVPRA